MNINEKYLAQNLAIDNSQTPEKFKHRTNEVVDFLTTILCELDLLEEETFEKFEVLKQKRSTPHQTHPDEKALWAEYHKRCKSIIAPVSTGTYSDKRSFGKPVKYAYVTQKNTKICFIMKSAGKAVIETEYRHGVTHKEQFVLKMDAGGWKVDSKKYGFAGEDTWYKTTL